MSSQVRYSRQSWLLLDREISPVLATWILRSHAMGNEYEIMLNFLP